MQLESRNTAKCRIRLLRLYSSPGLSISASRGRLLAARQLPLNNICVRQLPVQAARSWKSLIRNSPFCESRIRHQPRKFAICPRQTTAEQHSGLLPCLHCRFGMAFRTGLLALSRAARCGAPTGFGGLPINTRPRSSLRRCRPQAGRLRENPFLQAPFPPSAGLRFERWFLRPRLAGGLDRYVCQVISNTLRRRAPGLAEQAHKFAFQFSRKPRRAGAGCFHSGPCQPCQLAQVSHPFRPQSQLRLWPGARSPIWMDAISSPLQAKQRRCGCRWRT
jgi:hypothetical protein